MKIITIDKKKFELLDDNDKAAAALVYTSSALENAIIEGEEDFVMNSIATGVWVTRSGKDTKLKMKSRIRVEAGGIISVIFPLKKRKYFFKKSAGWKLRFFLSNREGEDLLTIIPNVNWQKQSHDFILQLNEEFQKECDPFLILHALHCANCSLSMMTGGEVPALVSI